MLVIRLWEGVGFRAVYLLGTRYRQEGEGHKLASGIATWDLVSSPPSCQAEAIRQWILDVKQYVEEVPEAVESPVVGFHGTAAARTAEARAVRRL